MLRMDCGSKESRNKVEILSNGRSLNFKRRISLALMIGKCGYSQRLAVKFTSGSENHRSLPSATSSRLTITATLAGKFWNSWNIFDSLKQKITP